MNGLFKLFAVLNFAAGVFFGFAKDHEQQSACLLAAIFWVLLAILTQLEKAK